MNNPNFTSALDRPADSIRPPPAYPIGNYLCVVDGMPAPGTAKTGTEYREMAYKIMQPQADVQVDPAEFPDGLNGKIIKGMSTRFYTSDDAIWRYVNFLHDVLGISKEGKSVKEMEAEAPGHQLFVTLRHVPSQDGTRMYHEVAGTAKV